MKSFHLIQCDCKKLYCDWCEKVITPKNVINICDQIAVSKINFDFCLAFVSEFCCYSGKLS